MNRRCVGQAFLPAGSTGFPARRTNWGLESPQNRPPGKAALRGSWSQGVAREPLELAMNHAGSADILVGEVGHEGHADKKVGAPAVLDRLPAAGQGGGEVGQVVVGGSAPPFYAARRRVSRHLRHEHRAVLLPDQGGVGTRSLCGNRPISLRTPRLASVISPMNHVECFRAVMNFQPVDRLPRWEWAVWGKIRLDCPPHLDQSYCRGALQGLKTVRRHGSFAA